MSQRRREFVQAEVAGDRVYFYLKPSSKIVEALRNYLEFTGYEVFCG